MAPKASDFVWNGSAWVLPASAQPAAATPSYNPNANTSNDYGLGTRTIPGLGPEKIWMSHQGTPYYMRGGSHYNLTPEQSYGLPTLSGVSPSGPGGSDVWSWGPASQAPAPVISAPKPNPNAPLPETNALADLKKIDPAAEAARAKLASQYSETLDKTNPQTAAMTQAQAERAGDYARAKAGTLPPGIAREIEQNVRNTQAGTGNTAGVSQAAQEAMTMGSAGLNYKNQTQSALEAANLNQNSYLNNVRGQVLGYLGSGQTPYSAGAQYTDRALNAQNAAATGQMVPNYNPYSQGNAPPAFTSIDPQAGNQFAAGTQGFMQQGVGATVGKPASGMGGALIGAGGAVGAAAITAAGGALFCQAARVIYGDATPEQLMFRDWILFKAPDWLRVLYAKHAEKFGKWVKNRPIARAVTKFLMDLAIRNANQKSSAPGITETPELALDR